ncbi:MAG: LPS export ABC transporter periplasmic protein LptC [Candidatus Omnitrophica bacterium]|nr:LPS export ABC transporter periplasmic protein LptC [Candidatus Omnitrophota bacterium]
MTGKVLVFICAACLSATGCARENKGRTNSAPPAELSDSQKEMEESPGEMLSSFSLSGYAKGGEKQWDLEGKSADIMSEEIKITDVTGKIYGKDTNMTIVADEGSLNRVDSNVHLEKDVLVTSDDGVTMTADYLDWDAQNERLTSESPVWIKRGMMQAYGTGIIAQPVLNLVELKKDVTVKMPPLTVITCAGPLEVDYQNNLAVFQDEVKVKDERGEILADKMDVYFARQAEESKQMQGMEGMGIEKVIATGDVQIHHGGNTTYSQKAVYDTDTGKLTLTGQPKLVIYSAEDFSQLMGSQ